MTVRLMAGPRPKRNAMGAEADLLAEVR